MVWPSNPTAASPLAGVVPPPVSIEAAVLATTAGPPDPPPLLLPPAVTDSGPAAVNVTSPVTPDVPPPPPIDCPAKPIDPAPVVAMTFAFSVLSGLPLPEIAPEAPTVCELPPAPIVSGSGTDRAPLPPPAPIACESTP